MTKPFIFLWRETKKFGWFNNFFSLLWLPWVVVFFLGTEHGWWDVLFAVSVMIVGWFVMDSSFMRGERAVLVNITSMITAFESRENNSAQSLDTGD